MIMTSGLLLALAGIGLGLALAAWASGLTRSLLYEVRPGDPLTFVLVGATLSLVAMFASLVPAWRATRVDPVVALKSE
jgi:ABC-type antimicrobial peptide transport system permease subunit